MHKKSSSGLKNERKLKQNKKMKFTKTYLDLKKDHFDDIKEQIFKNMFPPGIEPGTICVLGRCDNPYTTETRYYLINDLDYIKKLFPNR